MTKPEMLDAFLAWIQKRLAPAGATIGADTPLFADGLIDSMNILLIIAWIERAVGRTIPDRQIVMDNFETPRRIADVFAEG